MGSTGKNHTLLDKPLKNWQYYGLFVLAYTVIFLILSHLMFAPFAEADKTFLHTMDGRSQHFTRLMYISKTVRESFRSLFAGNGWSFPQFDYRLWMVREDLQIGFPHILAVFWPPDQLDSFYTFLVYLIFYLSGLSFSVMGLYFKQKPLPVLCGAFTYAFFGYAIYEGARYPHFFVPMIYLPLLIIGAEKVLRRERAWILPITVFLSLTSQWGLYYSCMQAVLLVIYFVVRFFDYYHEDRGRAFGRAVVRLCLWGGTGVLLGGFVAIPSLLSLVGIGRVGHDVTSYTNLLHYTKKYYEMFAANFLLSPKVIDDSLYWLELGFNVLALPALILIFLRHKKEERTPRVLFIVLTVMLLFPLVGYIMSGFSNVANRFCYAYALCIGVILMLMIPHFEELSRKTAGIVVAVTAGLSLVGLFVIEESYRQTAPIVALCVAVLILAACLLLIQSKREGLRRTLISLVCLVLTLCSVYYSSTLAFTSSYLNNFITDAYDGFESGQYHSLSMSEAVAGDESLFNVTGSAIKGAERNAAFYYDLNGLSMYPYYGWSTALMDLVGEMELPREGNKQTIYGLSTDATLLTLAGNKYYAMRQTSTAFPPYGYSRADEVQNGSNTDVILQNDNWLPIGYTYDRYITREEYDAMSALEKRAAQRQAAVLDTAPEGLTRADIQSRAQRLDFTWECQDMTWDNGLVTFDEDDATLMLHFDGLPNTETYVRITGFKPNNNSGGSNWQIRASTGTTSCTANFYADDYVYTPYQYDQMLDLGYTEEGFDTITLTFPSKGAGTMSGIEIWCEPMDDFAARMDHLRAETLTLEQVDSHGLTGTIRVSSDKILCVQLPYMPGWTAYVDGHRVPLLQVGTAFMGVALDAGEHTVQLRYTLPGLRAGLMLTAAGIGSAAGIIVYARRKKKTPQGDEEDNG